MRTPRPGVDIWSRRYDPVGSRQSNRRERRWNASNRPQAVFQRANRRPVCHNDGMNGNRGSFQFTLRMAFMAMIASASIYWWFATGSVSVKDGRGTKPDKAQAERLVEVRAEFGYRVRPRLRLSGTLVVFAPDPVHLPRVPGSMYDDPTSEVFLIPPDARPLVLSEVGADALDTAIVTLILVISACGLVLGAWRLKSRSNPAAHGD